MVDDDRCAVLLRAVNVTGRPLTMERFRAALVSAGATAVRTLGAAGTAVVERSPVGAPSSLERTIAQALVASAGLRTEVFVRSPRAWAELVRGNPFPEAARSDPAHLVVTLLRGEPPARAWEALTAAVVGREKVAPGGRHAYIVYPDGIGRSRLTAELIERHLGCPGTSRNWNTVLRVGEELDRARVRTGVKSRSG